MLKNYYQLDNYYYQKGIDDDPQTAKWGMKMHFLNLNQEDLEPFVGVNFGILGFKSDKGVYINNGRVGAVEGSTAIRGQLAKLPWHFHENVHLYDVGNIDGPNVSLEELQDSLAAAVSKMRSLNLIPIVLGGGHEAAYGHYMGLLNSIDKKEKLGVINFDAHFDLRPYEQTGPNSGTGFRQIFDQTLPEIFHYLILGIQEHNNNLFLFDFVSKSKAIEFLTGQDIYKMGYEKVCQEVDRFLDKIDKVYLTIDMDSFNYAFAPGVSAIQSLGVDPNLALIVFQHIAASGKLVGFDLVEVSPPHDQDNHTANLASSLVFYISQVLAHQDK